MVSSYFAEDEDIYAAENYYKDLESGLQSEINNIERDYGGYDEYNYDLAQIGHNPYELISYLTALYMDFTFDDVKQPLDDLFEQQYILTLTSQTETRTDDEGNDKLYIPSGKCVLTAPGAGRTAYGAVSQVEQSDGEFHTYAGRRVPKYVSSAEGNSRTLTISSRPLMIPNNKNPFIVADVLTD